ncbi:hypothetical protein P170DRAFT_473989 [Aspergillus steynii IBT 23096]|uniref:Uncharacterized protein n=1 Tax=Aspergillus steynii IBT 23096 TaxID=1392250 RepID=A0A2I2GC23_9EURO|nr:uncharacterized protein P170DRAFT_473989 [Aspergillus steynii IBT 23096]PLB50434.1 hypothetical protein P170DRAFT_473989 [Aspergillus steynii IBT 23096]
MEQHNRDSANHSEQSSNRPGENHGNRNDVPLDRLAEDPEYYKNFLEQLLDLVRNNNQADIARMVSVIRSGASHEEILAAISVVQGESNHAGQNGHAEAYDQNKEGNR